MEGHKFTETRALCFESTRYCLLHPLLVKMELDHMNGSLLGGMLCQLRVLEGFLFLVLGKFPVPSSSSAHSLAVGCHWCGTSYVWFTLHTLGWLHRLHRCNFPVDGGPGIISNGFAAPTNFIQRAKAVSSLIISGLQLEGEQIVTTCCI